jgi:hypothetical protein
LIRGGLPRCRHAALAIRNNAEMTPSSTAFCFGQVAFSVGSKAALGALTEFLTIPA